jgi:hypothetical protein
MATNDFRYSTLWKRMQRFPETDDIVVTVLSADYVAMKNQGRRCVPFLTRNMTACKVTDAALNAFPLYEHGMYAVYERAALVDSSPAHERQRALRRKQLFVVFPTDLRIASGREGRESDMEPFFTGDHFTFMVNPAADETERLQFHLTQYPGLTTDFVAARSAYTKDNMPLHFPLPTDAAAFKTQRLTKEDLQRDLFALPLYALFSKEGSQPPPQQQQHGGAKRASTARQRAARTAQRRGARPRAFDDLWHELPLHAMAIIGIRRRDGRAGYDVTVKVTDRLQHDGRDEYQLRPAARFTAPDMDQATVEPLVAAAASQWDWDTFTTVTSDDE